MWEKLKILKEQYAALDLGKVIDYEKFCMISIVWHSTKIEGCSLTETEEKADLNIFRNFIINQYCKFLQTEIDKHKQLNKGFMLMF